MKNSKKSVSSTRRSHVLRLFCRAENPSVQPHPSGDVVASVGYGGGCRHVRRVLPSVGFGSRRIYLLTWEPDGAYNKVVR